MRLRGRALLLGLAWSLDLGTAIAQSIYTCTDARGRRLTSDRPILDCIDREQREMTPSGTVKRRIGPSLTADEVAAEEDKARKAAEERNRAAEEKRRQRALVNRYPNQASHDKERVAALALIDGLIASSQNRSATLSEQRKKLDAEGEFYKGERNRMPPTLRRSLEQTEQEQGAQNRFVAEQQIEKQRIDTRFNEELVRLKVLWAQQASPVTTPVAVASKPAPTR